MSAFSAVQLRDRLEKSDRRRVESSGMLKSFSALSMSLGIPEPTVALFAVPPMLVVVQPESPSVAHVLPVKPLIQTQLHDRSALGIATPPFWQVMIPLHWLF